MKKLICNIVIFLFVFVSCSQEDIEMMDKVDNQKDENLFVQVDSINSKSNFRSVSLEFANATVKKYAIGYSMKFNPSPFTAPFIQKDKKYDTTIYEIKATITVPDGCIVSPFEGVISSTNNTQYVTRGMPIPFPVQPIDRDRDGGYTLTRHGNTVTIVTYEYAILNNGARFYFCGNTWIALGMPALFPYNLGY